MQQLVKIELPKIAGIYDVTVSDRTVFSAYFEPSSNHWLSTDTNIEIGFGLIITPIRSTIEQRIIKISDPLK
jgi:hypothetical protein